MLQHTTGEVNGSLTESRKGVPETSPEEDWDVLSVFDCDQNTIACIQPRLQRIRCATKAAVLSSVPKTRGKRKGAMQRNQEKLSDGEQGDLPVIPLIIWSLPTVIRIAALMC